MPVPHPPRCVLGSVQPTRPREQAVITLLTVDADGVPLRTGGAVITARVAPSGVASVVDNHDGTYSIAYTLTVTGPHELALKVVGVRLPSGKRQSLPPSPRHPHHLHYPSQPLPKLGQCRDSRYQNMILIPDHKMHHLCNADNVSSLNTPSTAWLMQNLPSALPYIKILVLKHCQQNLFLPMMIEVAVEKYFSVCQICKLHSFLLPIYR